MTDSKNFYLGEWYVDQSEGMIKAAGRTVRLEPRVMNVLVLLADRDGRVVTKEELLEEVWGNAFVEEGALSQAIHSLRKALGDDARNPRFIQTIPKRGYRLVAEVVLGPASNFPSSKSDKIADKTQVDERLGSIGIRWRQRVRYLLPTGGIVLMLVCLWLVREIMDAERQKSRVFAPIASNGKRVVVLPFETVNSDTYFANGLTVEITKDLMSLPELQIISNTSVRSYQDPRQLRDMIKYLRVDFILRGTVLWDKAISSKVRITLQLIRTDDDMCIWAESFDRNVDDFFTVQSEISRQVLGALGVTLLPDKLQELRTPSTRNVEAFRAYLRGLDLKNQPFYSEESLRKAESMFNRAIQLDGEFADAWAELSQVNSYLAFNTEGSLQRVAKAKSALERGMKLNPDLLSVRLAEVYFTYRCLEDFGTARKQLVSMEGLYPNNSEVLQALGFVIRRQGNMAEAIQTLRRAFSLDPRAFKLMWAIAETWRALRDYEQADQGYALAISMAADQPVFWEEKALNRLAWTGSLVSAKAVLEEAPIPDSSGLIPARVQLALYERDYQGTLAYLSSPLIGELSLQEQGRLGTLGVIARERLGKRREARASAEGDREKLEAEIARLPNDAFLRAYLAITLAQLGRKEEAFAQIRSAIRLRQGDAFTGPRIVQAEAVVYAILGDQRAATSRLRQLLLIPYQSSLTKVDLRLDPVWDPLRDYPAFRRLLGQSDVDTPQGL